MIFLETYQQDVTGSGPRATRYALAGVVLLWAAFSELGVLVFAYGVLEATVPGVPALPADSVAAQVTTPTFLVAVVAAFVATAAVGRRRYGSLAAFTVAVAGRADSLLGWTLFDEPSLVGRVEHDGVAWRFDYREDDRVETVRRECLLCGLELVEGVLRREVVHGPNVGLDPGEESRETAETAWTDVVGREKAEDHEETLALTCPECDFSVPGSVEVREGQDGARAKFRQHVDRMRSGNRRGEPFAEYVTAARERVGGEPAPPDVWDAYVRSADAEDALPVGPETETSAHSAAGGAGETTAEVEEREVSS